MTTDHIALAKQYFIDADELCTGDQIALAMAQVQATIGLGHAVLALAQHFRYENAPHVPISPEGVVR